MALSFILRKLDFSVMLPWSKTFLGGVFPILPTVAANDLYLFFYPTTLVNECVYIQTPPPPRQPLSFHRNQGLA